MPKKLAKLLLLKKVLCFKIAQKITKKLVYFWKKIYSQDLSKVAQSGHTGPISIYR